MISPPRPEPLPPAPAAADRLEAVQRRTMVHFYRVAHRLYAALDRDYERCGKASCARSRRCRGFACMPEVETDGEDTA